MMPLVGSSSLIEREYVPETENNTVKKEIDLFKDVDVFDNYLKKLVDTFGSRILFAATNKTWLRSSYF